VCQAFEACPVLRAECLCTSGFVQPAQQPVFREECVSVVGPGIALHHSADVVVGVVSEAIARDVVLPGQSAAEVYPGIAAEGVAPTIFQQ
jgi:hypothetical protein